MTEPEPLMATLFAEVLRDTHRYVPGREHRRPTLATGVDGRWRRALDAGTEIGRDALERAAARMGFTHGHFDPDVAGRRLAEVAKHSEGLEETYARLSDEHSRRAMLDMLKLRVLGPYHAKLAITPQAFRAKQADVERVMCAEAGTFDVSDPWFSPLSLYRIPMPDGSSVTMHGHSVELVSLFLLGQYRYTRGRVAVDVRPGDVVLDIGGCWGDTALYFAHLVGSAGKVYTFEFDPESLSILRANLELNPELAARVEVVERAVWERSGETLEFSQAGLCTALTDGADGGMPVESVTVDDFVEGAGITRLDLIKMDVEGAEGNVLRGAQASIERFGPNLAVAAYHHDDDLVTIPRAVPGASELFLDSYSPLEDETVLFARPTARSSST